MTQLSFAVLGIPEVRHGDQTLKFPTRKAQALLIYLLIEGGVHTRAALSAMFWPESSGPNSRAALRVTLAQLREALADGDQTKHLNIEHDSVGFNFASHFHSDAGVLLHGYQELRPVGNLQDGVRRQVTDRLHDAVAVYRGDFLQNFSLTDAPEFDDWASVQRETCHRQMDAVFERLAGLHFGSGETAEAVDTAARWVSHSPMNETAHRQLIQARFLGGDRIGALQAYETCREILQRELKVSPSPETTALAERIRFAAPHPRPAARSAERPPSAPMLLEAQMVGRANEFGKLIEVYSTACQNHAQVIVLQGEAGAGKTRLAGEFIRWAVAQGADVLEGRAFETGSRLPYQALVDAFRKRIAVVNAPEDLLSDVWLAELSRLLPELRERYPDLPTPTADETTARTRLYEAVAYLGLALAERAPIVLFIDDIQWADGATLDVLHYAARRWLALDGRIMLLLNLRSESLVTVTALSNWIADLARAVPVVSLPLSALSVDDTLQLVQALSADDEPLLPAKPNLASASGLQQFSQWLFAETNGQPFYIIETLKALLERGTLSLRPQPDGRWRFDFARTRDSTALRNVIPTGVREVIRSRLNYLQPIALTLVAAGAVLDHGFSFEHLCRVAAVDEDTGLTALEQTLTNRLLRETADQANHSTDSTYDFVHDKIREIVYSEMSEARRRIFHRRAFEILDDGTTAPAVLAHHAQAAALKEPAFHYSLRAGDGAMSLFAVRDAILHYEQARRLQQEQTKMDVSAEDLHQLYTQLGRAYELDNRFDQARSVYEDMLTFARQANLTSTMVVAFNRLATVIAQTSSDFERAILLLQESLHLAALGDDKKLLTETEWSLAQVKFHAWLPQDGLLHAERALALARPLNDTDLIARSLNILAILTIVLGEWTRSKAYAAEAASLYAATSNKALEADSLSHLANAYFLCAEFQEALNTARRMQQINVEIQNIWTNILSNFTLAATYRDMGFYDEALPHAQEASALARTSHIPILLLLSHMILGTVYRALRRLDDACAVHLDALQVAAHMAPRYSELITSELCADYALAEDWEAAYRYALEALSLRDYTFAPGAGLPRPYETEALLRGGSQQEALEDLARFEKQIGDGRRLRVSYLRSRAVVAHWQNHFEQETVYLQEAASLAASIGLAEEQWLIWAALGESYRVQGSRSGVEASSARAREVIRWIAARLHDSGLRESFLHTKSVERITT